MLVQNIKKFYEKIVDRLIMQYEEYMLLSEMIQELENDRFTQLAKFAKEKGISISDVSKTPNYQASFTEIDKKITLLKIDLQRISDEMTYSNHYVWMMYKDKAYKGTSTEIATLADFRRHCSPAGYICTARFKFLKSHLKERNGIDLDNIQQYPDGMKLYDFYNRGEITSLLEDVQFLAQWKKSEYLVSGDSINKWNTAFKGTVAK